MTQQEINLHDNKNLIKHHTGATLILEWNFLIVDCFDYVGSNQSFSLQQNKNKILLLWCEAVNSMHN